MNQDEICELLETLKESLSTKNWALVEDAIIYIKDYCHDYCDDSDE